MVVGEIDPWLGYQGRQPRNEIYRTDGRPIEGHLGRPIPVGRLQRVDHLTPHKAHIRYQQLAQPPR
jgi:hypothetical protein